VQKFCAGIFVLIAFAKKILFYNAHYWLSIPLKERRSSLSNLPNGNLFKFRSVFAV